MSGLLLLSDEELSRALGFIRDACGRVWGDAIAEHIEALTAERDAYRKAKAENDDRFMLERDQAREEVRRLQDRNNCARAALREILS